MTATTATRWTAWRRLPRDRWCPIAEGVTMNAAWRAGLTAAAEAGGSGELIVLPADTHPNDAPVTKQSARRSEAVRQEA